MKRSFPMESGSIAKHHPAWNPQCTKKPRKLLCPEPKVVPRFGLGDVREARWLLSHRWTKTTPILPDAVDDSRNQRRVVSLSALSLLSDCVRLRQLREVHHNLQQARNPQPLTDAERSNRRFTCTSLMLCLWVMPKVPSQSAVRSLLVMLLCKPMGYDVYNKEVLFIIYTS